MSDFAATLVAIGIFVGLTVLTFTPLILSLTKARRRRRKLQTWAEERGGRYDKVDPRWVREFNVWPLGVGKRKANQNVVTGTAGEREFVAFDYAYFTPRATSEHRKPHPFAVVAVRSGGAFPALSVTPEGFYSRFVGDIADTDIDFESEDFNRAFTVTCRDRKFASDVLHPAQMEFLLAHRDHSLQFDGPWVLSVQPGTYEPSEIEDRLTYLTHVIGLIPGFVRKDMHQ